MDPVARDARSKLLFNSEHMLAVSSHLAAGDPIFTMGDVCAATQVSRTSVHRLLGTLVDVGLLSRLPRTDNDRSQWYSRRPHPFWEAAQELARVDTRTATSSPHADGAISPTDAPRPGRADL